MELNKLLSSDSHCDGVDYNGDDFDDIFDLNEDDNNDIPLHNHRHYERVLELTDELLLTCTSFRHLQRAKAAALVALGRWAEAKIYIEGVFLRY